MPIEHFSFSYLNLYERRTCVHVFNSIKNLMRFSKPGCTINAVYHPLQIRSRGLELLKTDTDPWHTDVGHLRFDLILLPKTQELVSQSGLLIWLAELMGRH